MKQMKTYILEHFQYHELGQNFSRKMKEAVNCLRTMPYGYHTVGFQYRGYEIYLRPYLTYLIFYVIDEIDAEVTVLRVLQDGMNWKFIMKRWLEQDH